MAAFNLVEHYYGYHFQPPLSTSMGYPRVLAPHRRPYATSDGFICMMPYTDAHWRRFFESARRPDAGADPRFVSIGERTRNIDALYALAAELIATKTTSQWLDLCVQLEIPAARVNALEDLETDEHLMSTGFFQTIADPAMGLLSFPSPPARFDRERLPVRMPPRLGEHTDEVLGESRTTIHHATP
jgi:crotonobetainyl-CoA:carnitine CoA-transferase CaiB-like acyl-CoA transferase